jgi:hypothetical protein
VTTSAGSSRIWARISHLWTSGAVIPLRKVEIMAQAQTQSNEARRLSRGEIVSKMEDLGKSGNHDDVMSACKYALEIASAQGADDPYEVAISFLNAAAVAVPGTKTIWTERRLREFVDLGVKRPGL